MHSSIVWWNTSLSPRKAANRATAEAREIAGSLIERLALELGADLICLGEVGPADIEHIRSRPKLAEYAIYEGISKVGQSSFDICVLFRRASIDQLDHKTIQIYDGQAVLKVGQRIDFGLADNETILHLFVSHWPSRLWCGENHADRDRLGLSLARAVSEAIGEDNSGHAIVLGDFNDDPFARSLEQHLKATRDRDLAARKGNLLYNPFWKLMAPPVIAKRDPTGVPWTGGSYYYKQGPRTNWHTFDQIIFSSAFLGKSQWSLLDESVQVLNFPPYTTLVLDKNSKFDHMPVIATIARK